MLVGADLEKARFNKASFVKADLGGADLKGARADHAMFQGALLDGANLEGMRAKHADFSHADLSGATGSGMRLDDAVLVGANLDGADLSGSDVKDADFSGASLLGADLSSLDDAAKATFKDARYNNATVLDPNIDISVMVNVDDVGDDDPDCQGVDCDAPVGSVDDTDGDGWMDDEDNCLAVANSDQFDADSDGYGNVCDCDLNNDGIVGGPDFGLFGAAFGTSDGPADFNGDGVVGGPDYGFIGAAFGRPPGPSGRPCAGAGTCN